MRSKLQNDFLYIVQVAIHWYDAHNGKKYNVLGKALKVTDRELQHPSPPNVSDKVREFIDYQLYITKTRPVWYEGDQIKRT